MKGCLKVLGVFFVGFILLMIFLPDDVNEKEPEEADKMDAFYYAEQAVEGHLKAPSTAEFASYNPANITQEGNTFYVRSYVDSQNGFGAMVRSDFEVRVIFVDDKIQTRILKFE
jgi:hypothetical protein